MLCNVLIAHITASVFINDDERGLHADYEEWLEGLAPHEPISRYRHNRTGEDNGDAHLKRQIMGREVVVAITNGRLDDSTELVEVFGPWEQTVVPTQGYSIAIPPIIPGGFNLSGVPLVTPQLNIGLILGSELAIRYVPYTFEGTRMRFYGFGLKQELTRLPPLSLADLPFAIAVAGAYQKFTVESSNRETIISSKTLNLQAIISAKIGVFEPMIAFGRESTTADFDYIFEYEIPDTISGIPFEQLTIHEEISVHLKGENRYRTAVGLTLHMGMLFMHYDYNMTPYSTHNLTLGFSWR